MCATHMREALYPSRMGRAQADQGPDFAAVLGASIARHYGSRGAFARAAGVAEASVSRWVNRQSLPDRQRIQQIAPYVLDGKGRPYPAAKLLSLAHPDLSLDGGRDVQLRQLHRLALEIDELLGEGSTVPDGTREDLESVLESLLNPYRRYLKSYLRRRKTG